MINIIRRFALQGAMFNPGAQSTAERPPPKISPRDEMSLGFRAIEPGTCSHPEVEVEIVRQKDTVGGYVDNVDGGVLIFQPKGQSQKGKDGKGGKPQKGKDWKEPEDENGGRLQKGKQSELVDPDVART